DRARGRPAFHHRGRSHQGAAMSEALIDLAWWQLAIGAALVVALAVVTHLGRLGLSRDLLVAATRMVIQLAIIGVVLETLFSLAALRWVALMAIIMLLLAGREVMSRQKRRMTGGWAFAIGTVSMFISSFAVTVFALLVV